MPPVTRPTRGAAGIWAGWPMPAVTEVPGPGAYCHGGSIESTM